MFRPSYANVVATLALLVATSGGAYAATQLPRNSVGAKQVRDHSLTARDFKPGQVPAGTPGSQGPAGATGATGAPGAPGPDLLVAGAENGATTSLPGCTTYDLRGDDFTVPGPAVLELHAQAGYSNTGNVPHVPNLVVRLFDATELAVAQVPFASAGLTATTQLVTGGVATGVSTVYRLQPGTTYHAVLSLDPGGGGCAGSTVVDSPSFSWLAYPAPN